MENGGPGSDSGLECFVICIKHNVLISAPVSNQALTRSQRFQNRPALALHFYGMLRFQICAGKSHAKCSLSTITHTNSRGSKQTAALAHTTSLKMPINRIEKHLPWKCFSYATLSVEGITQESGRRRRRKEAKQVTFESEVYDQILERSMHARNLKLNTVSSSSSTDDPLRNHKMRKTKENRNQSAT